MHHELKIEPRYYQALFEERKTCEVRFNDRDYQSGDTVSFFVKFPHDKQEILDHIAPKGYYSTLERWEITHVLHYPDALKEGWVVLSLRKI